MGQYNTEMATVLLQIIILAATVNTGNTETNIFSCFVLGIGSLVIYSSKFTPKRRCLIVRQMSET